MEKDTSKIIFHLERIINNLNQHWSSIQLLLGHVSKPLLVDDRGLAKVLVEFKQYMQQIFEEMKSLDLCRMSNEIQFIGKRLYEIENHLKSFSEKGIDKNISLNFTCEGYQLIKKDRNIDKIDIKSTDVLDDEIIIKILDLLTKKEKDVLMHRVGILGKTRKTFSDIASIVHISAERCSKIYKKVLVKLRHPSRRSLIEQCTHIKLRKEILGEENQTF
jgi:DNA-directed RNA polymerase sigma subunit (sigma70/sigma32)